MFEMETFKANAIDVKYAEKRMRNEPIVEITQVKGLQRLIHYYHQMMNGLTLK